MAMALSGCTSGSTDAPPSRIATSSRTGVTAGTDHAGGPGHDTTGSQHTASPPLTRSGTSSSLGTGRSGSQPGTERISDQVPTAASLAAVRKGLPADPVDATDALVAKVFDPDVQVATAAAAEILRRAGLPLVSAEQPILALPDTGVIVNHQIPAEMVPSLAYAVRSGQQYTLQQAAELLSTAGATDGTFTGNQLVAVLARWGKSPGDPPESVVAGAAERALGAWHHQLLDPQTVITDVAAQEARDDLAHAPAATLAALTDPQRVTGLDPLQVILLLAHATSYAAATADVRALAPSLRRDGAALHTRDAAPASNTVCSFLDFSDTFGGTVAHGVQKNAFRQALIQGAKLALKTGAAVAKFLGKAFVVYDVATDVLTTVLMLTGIKTEISFDKATTHFRHQHHDLSRDVAVTATVTFHSALQGDNGQYHGCWRFAGVTMPQNGGVKGWLVHWDVDGPVVVLRKDNLAPIPTSGPADVDAPTDANGQTWVAMQPRTEKEPPPKGQQDSYPEHVMVNQITAEPDPNLDLVKPGDIFNLGAFLVNPLAPVILELEKMINRAIRNHLLPETTVPYRVSYHEKQPYTIKSDGFMTIPLAAGVRMKSDLYSCTGPAGPWQGTITFSAGLGTSYQIVKNMLGVSGATGGQFSKPISFTLDPHSGGRQQIHIPTETGDMGLWIQLDQAAVQQAMHATDGSAPPAVVGTGSWSFGGEDVTQLSQLLGPALSNGLALPVVATPLDPRCTGGTLADDAFDED